VICEEEKEGGLNSVIIMLLVPSDDFVFHRFNIDKLYILPTLCIYVFLWIFYNREGVCLLRRTN
jgi:hypothetical protein